MKDRDKQTLAYQLLGLTGEVLDEGMAKALGLPVGTRTIEAERITTQNIVDRINADANAKNAATNAYEAETNRAHYERADANDAKRVELDANDQTFQQMISKWAATGKPTDDVAAYLGIEPGTLFYEYAHDANMAALKKKQ
jgi:hypothetical protein